MNKARNRVPHGYWKNKERCAVEASNYKTKTEFKKGSPSAFESAYKNGWLDEICTHMRVLIHHFSDEEIFNKASEFETMTEFMEKAQLYYDHAHRKGLLNKIKKRMKSLGTPEKRSIYVFEFGDNHAYIGLTMNIERRKNEHFSDKGSPVYKYMQESSLNPVLKS